MGADPELEPHVVVFDVNVYLDIAGLVEQPFTWQQFDDLAGAVMSQPNPHPKDARLDSLRAVAVSRSGQLCRDVKLEVWTSSHIDNLVLGKAQTVVPDCNGALWTKENAIELHDTLVNDLVYDLSSGGSVGEIKIAVGNPPLDHEDGCVFATAMRAGEDDPALRFCVTRDTQFRESSSELHPRVSVVYPHEYLQMVLLARKPSRLPIGTVGR
ncbi:hypothetical protein [Rhodococcus sp. NPDC056516]|uniref:hypothetical protein n=1 Tax=Rhodococcus sp. NPDC056516 TaxID=3345847 RepID=UPI0036732B76